MTRSSDRKAAVKEMARKNGITYTEALRIYNRGKETDQAAESLRKSTQEGIFWSPGIDLTDESRVMMETSHIVIEGKSGSGKSTILHDMIQQISDRYSTEEVKIWAVEPMIGLQKFKSIDVVDVMVDNWSPDQQFSRNVVRMLQEVKDEVDRRIRLNAEGSSDPSHLIVVMNAFGERTFSDVDKQDYLEVCHLVSQIASTGRSVRVQMMITTASTGEEFLSGSTLGNFTRMKVSRDSYGSGSDERTLIRYNDGVGDKIIRVDRQIPESE